MGLCAPGAAAKAQDAAPPTICACGLYATDGRTLNDTATCTADGTSIDITRSSWRTAALGDGAGGESE
jgi:hypothetical protein